MITELTNLHYIFEGARIVALCGVRHSGKTNNLCTLIKQYISIHKSTPVYAYGMPKEVMQELNKLGVKEISSLDQLIEKKNSIIILDEFQKLKLNDRRYKDELAEVVDFIYHSGNYLLLSSPNIREFNSVIGGVIEKWLLKTVRIDQCIRGSQLKEIVEKYKGRYKSLGSIVVDKSEILVINDKEEMVLEIPYSKEFDSKRSVKKLF